MGQPGTVIAKEASARRLGYGANVMARTVFERDWAQVLPTSRCCEDAAPSTLTGSNLLLTLLADFVSELEKEADWK